MHGSDLSQPLGAVALHVLMAITLEGSLWLSSELSVTSASHEAAET
jgi:hypothetical protein